MSYWLECIEVAFDEYGIKATKEQIENVATDVEVAYDNYGIYSGHEVATSNLHASIESERKEEIKRLEKQHDLQMEGAEKSHKNSIERLERVIRDIARENERLRSQLGED